MEARTDIHRPSSPDFDPEAYDCWGVFDNSPGVWGVDQIRARVDLVNVLIKDGYKFGHGSSHQCGHCGAAIRYCALMVHKGAKEFIFIGETCLYGRFSMLKGEFQTLRRTAKLNAQLEAKAERIAQIYEDHPLLVWLSYWDNVFDAAGSGSDRAFWSNGFLNSIAWKLEQYGELSERQIAAAERTIIEDTQKMDAKAAQKAAEAAEPKTEAPEGRVTVTGEVVSVKSYEDNYYGHITITVKMLVKDDQGFKVWSTVPNSLFNSERNGVEKGDRVTFTATLIKSADDPYFAKAKRPTKAEVLPA